MQVLAIHGEAAAYGHTGDANGQVGLQATPPTDSDSRYEGALSSGGSQPGQYWDDTTWVHSCRKDVNGNGGRYCAGSYSNASHTQTFRPRSEDKTVKEGWIRFPIFLAGPTNAFVMEIEGASYNVTRRRHFRFSLNQSTTTIYTYFNGSPIIGDTRVTDTAKDGLTWHVFEIAFKIDPAAGYIRVYKNFDYTTPYLEFVGDTYDEISGVPISIEEFLFTVSSGGGGANDFSCMDDVKVQNLTFRGKNGGNGGDDGFLPIGLAFDRASTTGELCNFYDRGDATQATGTWTVNQSPLSGGGVGVILVNGQGLTGVSGAPTSPGEFQYDAGSIDAIAQSIVDAINDPANPGTHDPLGRTGFSATNDGGGVITITADVLGLIGNLVPLQNNYGAPDITPAGTATMTGAAEGTLLARGTIWNSRNSEQSYFDALYEMHTLLDGSLVAWDGRAPIAVNSYARPHDGVNVTDGYYNMIGDTIDRESGYCGDGYFYEAMVPNGVGTFGVNQTRGGVDQLSNWQQVNDGVGVDGEASYNFALAGFVIDTYTYTNFGIVDGDLDGISGLYVYSRVKKVSEAPDNFAPVGQSGALLFGVLHFDDLTTGFSTHVGSMAENPDGLGLWTQASLNAINIGTNFG